MPGRVVYKCWSALPFGWPPSSAWISPDTDLIHGTNYVAPPDARRPTLITVHDLYPLRRSGAVTQFPQALSLVRKAVQNGAHVHAVSEVTADDARELLHVPQDRLHKIPLGGPQPREHVTPAQDRDKIILAIGTAEPRKNFGNLIRAFAHVVRAEPGATLIIAGPGVTQSRYGQGLSDLAAELGVRDRVDLRDWVSSAERDILLGSARILAYPSEYEGFGFPILEGFAAGAAVATSGEGSTREVAGDAAIYTGTGVETIADALIELLRHDELVANLCALAENQLATFSWTKHGEKMADLYERLKP